MFPQLLVPLHKRRKPLRGFPAASVAGKRVKLTVKLIESNSYWFQFVCHSHFRFVKVNNYKHCNTLHGCFVGSILLLKVPLLPTAHTQYFTPSSSCLKTTVVQVNSRQVFFFLTYLLIAQSHKFASKRFTICTAYYSPFWLATSWTCTSWFFLPLNWFYFI